ncbi:Gp15 family bacteriophage protein [Companilactobacillus mishanensis]|uniref:Uncharacterized protein n=1 Tax=Companilactobacillus mishanensis TaxID=2486008 RepID=A0A5P0ZF27_9LACO|nr:Gp15 family bacteriophage protein [Companilactobacillus mishanensis]MQS44241.1 hypothetical protein [Companilactobacillus mishanensis]MQS51654.1 hypothetical protein [Companilactobacillus mishanensis]
MLSLSSKLDNTILTRIGELPIDLNFNNVLRWYEMADRDDMSKAEKIVAAWYIFLGSDYLSFTSIDDFEVASDAIESISDYISQDPYMKKGEETASNAPYKSTRWFSYTEDSEAIYASFLFDYGIDLIEEQNKMRWEKFRALFNNLSSKSPIMKIIDIRQTDISKYEGQELIDLVEAQSYYSLETSSVDKINESFNNMFSVLQQSTK